MGTGVLAFPFIGNLVRAFSCILIVDPRDSPMDDYLLVDNQLRSFVHYPSTDVGVGRPDDSGVGTPWMHELDNMDASVSGNPWYPLECIVVLL